MSDNNNNWPNRHQNNGGWGSSGSHIPRKNQQQQHHYRRPYNNAHHQPHHNNSNNNFNVNNNNNSSFNSGRQWNNNNQYQSRHQNPRYNNNRRGGQSYDGRRPFQQRAQESPYAAPNPYSAGNNQDDQFKYDDQNHQFSSSVTGDRGMKRPRHDGAELKLSGTTNQSNMAPTGTAEESNPTGFYIPAKEKTILTKEEFFNLPTREDKYEALLPLHESTADLPPEGEMPKDWEIRKDKAAEKTKAYIACWFPQQNNDSGNSTNRNFENSTNYNEDDYYDEDDGSDDDDSDSETSNPYGPKDGFVIVKATTKHGYTKQQWEHFVDCLKYCLPMEIGFKALPINSDAQKWCYCPCDKQIFPTWKNIFGITVGSEICNSPRKMEPVGLLGHLKTKKVVCHVHDIIYVYLENLFDGYLVDGSKSYRHPAFYVHSDNKNLKKAEALQLRLRFRAIEELKEKILQGQRERDQREAKLRQLETKSLDMSKRLQEQDELIQNLNLRKEDYEVKEISSHMLDKYKRNYQDGWEHYRYVHRVRDVTDATQHNALTLKVGKTIILQQLFDTWSTNDKSGGHFFFRSLQNVRSKDKFYHCSKFFLHCNVQFDVAQQVKNKAVNKDLQAVDHGGPTREFFSKVWQQMGDLVVSGHVLKSDQRKQIEIKLFEKHNVGLIPLTDEFIFSRFLGNKMTMELQPKGIKVLEDEVNRLEGGQEILERVKHYYRAIGRIMFLCMATDSVVQKVKHEGQGMGQSIASSTVPKLFRNKLFRGIDPIDKDEYKEGDIVSHLAELFDMEPRENNNSSPLTLAEKVAKNCFEVDNELRELTVDGIRRFCQERYIDGRRISLEAIQEGLTLGGGVRLTSFFQAMPLAAVNKMVFSTEEITVDQIINVLEIKRHEHTIHLDDQDLLFKEGIPNVLRKWEKEEKSLLQKFVRFISGHSYLPCIEYQTDFKLIIEFNFEELDGDDSLPVGHTCENILKLPGTAYGANEEKFEEKMKKSLDCMADSSFNIQ